MSFQSSVTYFLLQKQKILKNAGHSTMEAHFRNIREILKHDYVIKSCNYNIKIKNYDIYGFINVFKTQIIIMTCKFLSSLLLLSHNFYFFSIIPTVIIDVLCHNFDFVRMFCHNFNAIIMTSFLVIVT